MNTYMHYIVYTCVWGGYIIYIYIERERERELIFYYIMFYYIIYMYV